MKKYYIIATILFGLWAIPEAIGAVFLFLFIGRVPIINIIISPSIIFISSVLLLSGIVSHLIITAVQHVAHLPRVTRTLSAIAAQVRTLSKRQRRRSV